MKKQTKKQLAGYTIYHIGMDYGFGLNVAVDEWDRGGANEALYKAAAWCKKHRPEYVRTYDEWIAEVQEIAEKDGFQETENEPLWMYGESVLPEWIPTSDCNCYLYVMGGGMCFGEITVDEIEPNRFGYKEIIM